MGAGHGYGYENFILIEENEINGINYDNKFLDTLDGLPLKEQCELIVKEGYQGLESQEQIEEMFEDNITDTIVSKENCDDIEIKTLDIESLQQKNYASDRDYTINDFKETLCEIGKTTNNEYFNENHFNADENLSDFGSLTISSELMTNSAEIKLAMIADGYNAGIVSYIEDAEGYSQTKAKDLDFQNILLSGYIDDDVRDYLDRIADNEEYLDSYEPLIDFIEECGNALNDEELKTLFKEHHSTIYDYVYRQINYAQDGTTDGLKERCKNDPYLAEQLNEYATIVSSHIHNLVKDEANILKKKYQDFTDEFMNRTILSYQDGAFYYPTSAWTSNDYERDNKLFGDNKEIINKIKTELNIPITIDIDDDQIASELKKFNEEKESLQKQETSQQETLK